MSGLDPADVFISHACFDGSGYCPPVRLTRKRPALAASTQMIPYARPASTMEERQALTTSTGTPSRSRRPPFRTHSRPTAIAGVATLSAPEKLRSPDGLILSGPAAIRVPVRPWM